jgi:hypothetical protein
MGSEAEGQEVYEGCGGGGEDVEDSDGLGFPNMAERIEYSRFAASDPKVKFGSNDAPNNGSACAKGSAGAAVVALDKITDGLRRNMARRTTNLGELILQAVQSLQAWCPKSYQRIYFA